MIVLDASALLAYLFGEPGAEAVAAALDRAVISAVNEAEVLSRLLRDHAASRSLALPVHEVVAFDSAQARLAAELDGVGRPRGLSLADRACLALASSRQWPVLTADRAWRELEIGVEVRLIRS